MRRIAPRRGSEALREGMTDGQGRPAWRAGQDLAPAGSRRALCLAPHRTTTARRDARAGFQLLTLATRNAGRDGGGLLCWWRATFFAPRKRRLPRWGSRWLDHVGRRLEARISCCSCSAFSLPDLFSLGSLEARSPVCLRDSLEQAAPAPPGGGVCVDSRPMAEADDLVAACCSGRDTGRRASPGWSDASCLPQKAITL